MVSMGLHAETSRLRDKLIADKATEKDVDEFAQCLDDQRFWNGIPTAPRRPRYQAWEVHAVLLILKAASNRIPAYNGPLSNELEVATIKGFANLIISIAVRNLNGRNNDVSLAIAECCERLYKLISANQLHEVSEALADLAVHVTHANARKERNDVGNNSGLKNGSDTCNLNIALWLCDTSKALRAQLQHEKTNPSPGLLAKLSLLEEHELKTRSGLVGLFDAMADKDKKASLRRLTDLWEVMRTALDELIKDPVVHFKRYSHPNAEGSQQPKKLMTAVELPECLFAIPGYQTLFYVSYIGVHIGATANGGHYYCFVRGAPSEMGQGEDVELLDRTGKAIAKRHEDRFWRWKKCEDSVLEVDLSFAHVQKHVNKGDDKITWQMCIAAPVTVADLAALCLRVAQDSEQYESTIEAFTIVYEVYGREYRPSRRSGAVRQLVVELQHVIATIGTQALTNVRIGNGDEYEEASLYNGRAVWTTQEIQDLAQSTALVVLRDQWQNASLPGDDFAHELHRHIYEEETLPAAIYQSMIRHAHASGVAVCDGRLAMWESVNPPVAPATGGSQDARMSNASEAAGREGPDIDPAPSDTGFEALDSLNEAERDAWAAESKEAERLKEEEAETTRLAEAARQAEQDAAEDLSRLEDDVQREIFVLRDVEARLEAARRQRQGAAPGAEPAIVPPAAAVIVTATATSGEAPMLDTLSDRPPATISASLPSHSGDVYGPTPVLLHDNATNRRYWHLPNEWYLANQGDTQESKARPGPIVFESPLGRHGAQDYFGPATEAPFDFNPLPLRLSHMPRSDWTGTALPERPSPKRRLEGADAEEAHARRDPPPHPLQQMSQTTSRLLHHPRELQRQSQTQRPLTFPNRRMGLTAVARPDQYAITSVPELAGATPGSSYEYQRPQTTGRLPRYPREQQKQSHIQQPLVSNTRRMQSTNVVRPNPYDELGFDGSVGIDPSQEHAAGPRTTTVENPDSEPVYPTQQPRTPTGLAHQQAMIPRIGIRPPALTGQSPVSNLSYQSEEPAAAPTLANQDDYGCLSPIAEETGSPAVIQHPGQSSRFSYPYENISGRQALVARSEPGTAPSTSRYGAAAPSNNAYPESVEASRGPILHFPKKTRASKENDLRGLHERYQVL
ncbi:hypothetical protein LTR36_008339 [Oleoguttula mirabilis]|uniref:USP domain-containing protein n=1 Tax=Oleoguttula mirabilis TaxID=1507867 RepID=A0AAV9J9P1_9PEZI|nr:hypothetical protein LTR36_008339 [Oleoguttula mirabilis]